MKVKDIYQQYMTPKALENHLLWVAAFAEILLENWKGQPIDKNAIITCCLFHDIAKPINFDLTKQAQYGMSEEDIEKLAMLQKQIKEKYGNVEHHAAVMICKDIGLSDAAVTLVDHLEWEYTPKWIAQNDIASLIPIYCDMRISPQGILPLETRINELYERVGGENYHMDMQNGKAMEPIIAEQVLIDVNGITQEQIAAKVEALLNLEI